MFLTCPVSYTYYVVELRFKSRSSWPKHKRSPSTQVKLEWFTMRKAPKKCQVYSHTMSQRGLWTWINYIYVRGQKNTWKRRVVSPLTAQRQACAEQHREAVAWFMVPACYYNRQRAPAPIRGQPSTCSLYCILSCLSSILPYWFPPPAPPFWNILISIQTCSDDPHLWKLSFDCICPVSPKFHSVLISYGC